MGMSPSVTSLFCFFDIVDCSQFYQSIDRNMIVFFLTNTLLRFPYFHPAFILL